MTTDTMTKEQYKDLMSEIRDLKTTVSALPDKSAIYTASLAIHGVIWATILGTVIALNAFGLIS